MKKAFLTLILIFFTSTKVSAIKLKDINSSNFIFDNKYLNVVVDKYNCGNHIRIGQFDKIILKDVGNTYDFVAKSIIIKEHKLFKKTKKLSIYYDYDFKEPIFNKEFDLIHLSDNYYVFAAEYDAWPDKNFYKNILFFTIDRLDMYIDAGTILIEDTNDYKTYKSFNFDNLSQNEKLVYSIRDKLNEIYFADPLKILKTKNKSVVDAIPLALCKIEVVEKKEPKI